MWIFLSNAFLSIVDKGGDGTTLLVRARRQGELEAVFPNAVVRETPHHDYRFRARIRREEVAAVMAQAVRTLAYSNFKDTVKDRGRHQAYLDVWYAMHEYQHREG